MCVVGGGGVDDDDDDDGCSTDSVTTALHEHAYCAHAAAARALWEHLQFLTTPATEQSPRREERSGDVSAAAMLMLKGECLMCAFRIWGLGLRV